MQNLEMLEAAALGGHNVLAVGDKRDNIAPVIGILAGKHVRTLYSEATTPALLGHVKGDEVRPGAAVRAHGGILELVDAPEFKSRVLRALREPLEQGTVTLKDKEQKAIFQMVLTARRCSDHKHVQNRHQANAACELCNCTDFMKQRYFSRLSGPILDRVDMQITVDFAEYELRGLLGYRERVEQARGVQAQTLDGTPWRTYNVVPGSYLRCRIKDRDDIHDFLNQQIDKGVLSCRGADKALRVAHSFAALDGKQHPTMEHIEQAMACRLMVYGII
jgi:magnesium chelatase family protein